MSIVPTILYFIACFAAGCYFADSQYKGRKIKRIEQDNLSMKSLLDKMRGPPDENTFCTISSDKFLRRTAILTLYSAGMENLDRILIKAPGRKDRVVLLRPRSRKMAKVKNECIEQEFPWNKIKKKCPSRQKPLRSPK